MERSPKNTFLRRNKLAFIGQKDILNNFRPKERGDNDCPAGEQSMDKNLFLSCFIFNGFQK